MRNRLFFWTIVIAFLLVVSFSFSNMDKTQISGEVTNKLESSENVRVAIKTENKNSLFNSVTINESKEDIKEILGNKTRHEFSKIISANVSKEDINKIRKLPGVKSVELVNKKNIFLSESNPLVNASYSNKVHFSGKNITGKGETVCVLDTGVNFAHEFLQGRNETCVIGCTGQTCVEDCSLSDDHGHGTHCAGIVAGDNSDMRGMAPEAGLIGVKVCDSSGNCYDDDIKGGIDWCNSHASEYNISVISISLGGGLYEDYCDNVDDPSDITGSINDATGNNISVVVATGNDGSASEIASPACIKNATPVGDTYDADVGGVSWGSCSDSSTYADKIVCHSNRNNITDLFAPGALIYSSWETGYENKGGTSMATPHVSGTAALINQYKRLESNKTLKPSEIESGLNKSGKTIYDSDSGLNFSRIKTYSSLIHFDEKSPSVSLAYPRNNTINISSGNFSCNSSDELEVSNITLKIWNSTGNLTNQTSANSSSIENYFNLTEGSYHWNCLSYDSSGNKGFYDSNYSLTIGGFLVDLRNASGYINKNKTNFTCYSQTYESRELENITFKVWENSSLIYNKTENISGVSNQTDFNYTFSNETTLEWNCLAYDNSSNHTSSDSNNTITYDETNPNVTLVSPENEASFEGSKEIDFKFNITEKYPENCTLNIEDEEISSSEINSSETNKISKTVSEGEYKWNISCYDPAGNYNASVSRNLTITSSTDSDSPSGGGGGGGTTSTEETEDDQSSNLTKQISSYELETGKSYSLSEGDRLSFSSNDASHEIELKSILNTIVKINIYSDKKTIYLSENETRKINLDSDGFYDLEIKLNNISSEKSDIFVKEIHQEIPSKGIFNNESSETNKTENNETGNKTKEETEKQESENLWPYIIAGVVIILISLAIRVYISKKTNS